MPRMVFEAHEVHPSHEVDWTLCRDWEAEIQNRLIRNLMIKEMLQSGRSVQFRSSGNSLKPKVISGDVTMWEPVTDHSLLQISDIVFCCTQPKGLFYGHAIRYIQESRGETYWWIGNLQNPPSDNGWCCKEHIYGQLYEVSGVQADRG